MVPCTPLLRECPPVYPAHYWDTHSRLPMCGFKASHFPRPQGSYTI